MLKGRTVAQAHRRAFFESLEDRVNPAPGDLDLTFGGGDGIVTTAIGPFGDFGYSVAVDSAGKYVVAGQSENGSNLDVALSRYTSTGVLDTTFGGGDGIVTTPIGSDRDEGYSVAVDNAGNYVVAGYTDSGGDLAFALIRYTSAGVLDTTFGGGDGIVTTLIGSSGAFGISVAVDGSGRYVVAGYSSIFLTHNFALTRYTSAGVLDTTFGGGDGIVTTSIGSSHAEAYSVAVDGAGRYVVAGHSSNGSNNDFTLVRYTSAGVLDTTFGGGDGIVTTNVGASDDYGRRVAVDSSGKYIVAGFSQIGSTEDFALTRYTSTGVLDTTFGGGDGIVTTPIGSASDDEAWGARWTAQATTSSPELRATDRIAKLR